MFELLYSTGIRVGELLGLKVADIDFKNKTIRVVGKGNKLAVLPMLNDLLDDLKYYLNNRKEGYVFPSSHKKSSPISPNHINRIVAKAGRKAKLKNPNPKLKTINPHILRHSCARILKDNGAPLETIQAIMRHAKFETTMNIYGTKSADNIQEDYEEYMKLWNMKNLNKLWMIKTN